MTLEYTLRVCWDLDLYISDRFSVNIWENIGKTSPWKEWTVSVREGILRDWVWGIRSPSAIWIKGGRMEIGNLEYKTKLVFMPTLLVVTWKTRSAMAAVTRAGTLVAASRIVFKEEYVLFTINRNQCCLFLISWRSQSQKSIIRNRPDSSLNHPRVFQKLRAPELGAE